MKKLVALISTVGKTNKQISKEAWEAVQKYRRVHEESLANVAQETAQHPNQTLPHQEHGESTGSRTHQQPIPLR